MDKIQMAHEWAINSFDADFESEEERAKLAWQYADAMFTEAEKREDKSRPDVLEEWQPDWSVAPDDAVAWEYLGHGGARWHLSTDGKYFKQAPSFGYTGNWRDSLRKRP